MRSMAGIVHDTAKPALEVKDLRVVLGANTALEGISFALHGGDSVAVVGPNGAGKSTLFRAIAGTIEHQAGPDHRLRERARQPHLHCLRAAGEHRRLELPGHGVRRRDDGPHPPDRNVQAACPRRPQPSSTSAWKW